MDFGTHTVILESGFHLIRSSHSSSPPQFDFHPPRRFFHHGLQKETLTLHAADALHPCSGNGLPFWMSPLQSLRSRRGSQEGGTFEETASIEGGVRAEKGGPMPDWAPVIKAIPIGGPNGMPRGKHQLNWLTTLGFVTSCPLDPLGIGW